MNTPPPRDLDAVWRWCSDLVDTVPGDIPLIGSPAWVAAPHHVKVAGLARFAVAALDLEEPHMLAYRLAVELTCERRQLLTEHDALRDASHDVAAVTDWARVARNHIPAAELDRRRYPPHGRDAHLRAAADRADRA